MIKWTTVLSTLMLLTTTTPYFCVGAHAIESKCTACRLVASALSEKLTKDAHKISNDHHIDLRGRLDSKGQRIGSTIAYKDSELRIVEMFEDVCETDAGSEGGLEDVWYDTLAGTWRGKGEKGILKPKKESELKTQRKEVSGFCHGLVERTEEAFMRAVDQGVLNAENVNVWLCEEATKSCDDEERTFAHDKDEDDEYDADDFD